MSVNGAKCRNYHDLASCYITSTAGAPVYSLPLPTSSEAPLGTMARDGPTPCRRRGGPEAPPPVFAPRRPPLCRHIEQVSFRMSQTQTKAVKKARALRYASKCVRTVIHRTGTAAEVIGPLSPGYR